MSVKYHIDRRRRLIVTTGEGRVTFAEAKEHQDRLLSDPDFDPEFDQLIDMTNAEELEITAEEAVSLASRPVVSQESRRAFVAGNKAIFGMGRLMETHHELRVGGPTGVFYHLSEALDWLGADRKTRGTSASKAGLKG